MTLSQISNNLAEFCKTTEGIDLAATLPEEFFYNSLDLCVIDAVFSIGVNYSGVKNVVTRYKEYVEKTYPNLSGKIRTVDESIAIFESYEITQNLLTQKKEWLLDLLRRGWITGTLSNGKISEGDTFTFMGKYIIRNSLGTLPQFEDISQYEIYVNESDGRCYCDI